MMKKNLLLFTTVLLAISGRAQTWNCGYPNLSDVTATLSGNTLTIRGVNLDDATLQVPVSSVSTYKNADIWKGFENIEGLAEYFPEPYLYIEKVDGNITEFPFSNSEIMILDDLITVNTPSGEYLFSYNEVSSLSFNLKNDTGIKKIITSNLRIFLDNTGNLQVSNESPLEYIAIYTVTGQLLKKINTNATEISINISNFVKGVYLVKVKGGTAKIVR